MKTLLLAAVLLLSACSVDSDNTNSFNDKPHGTVYDDMKNMCNAFNANLQDYHRVVENVDYHQAACGIYMHDALTEVDCSNGHKENMCLYFGLEYWKKGLIFPTEK